MLSVMTILVKSLIVILNLQGCKIDRRKIDYNTDKNIDENVLGTGPMFVFVMWKMYSKTNDDICVTNISLFHPPSKKNQDYIEELKEKGCYGMHICTGLWRNNEL